MPNNVQSEITLHGVPLEKARPFLFDLDGKLSFEVLLPLPLNIWKGSVGLDHEKAFPGTGLDAARATWGTKWDAYGDPEVVERDGSTIITFETAWGHPRGWTVALFNILQCPITAKWLDEGCADAFCEQYEPAGRLGPEWKTEKIKEGTDEHRRLHKMLWGVEQFEEEE